MKGFIYKISNSDESIVYVGSTIKTIEQRWSKHKAEYKRWIDGRTHPCAIYHHFKEYGIDKFKIVKISEHEVDDRKQLLEFEQLTIDRTENICNRYKACQTYDQHQAYMQQYREANHDKLKKYINDYYQSNKEQIKAKQREKHNCECGGRYTHAHGARHLRSKKHQDYIASQSKS